MISRHRARSYRPCAQEGRQYPGFLVVQPVADGALNRGPPRQFERHGVRLLFRQKRIQLEKRLQMTTYKPGSSSDR